MNIQKNSSLKPYNTFGVDVLAKELVIIESLEDLRSILPRLKDIPYLFLGGGSNVLFKQDFDGLVILNQIKGIDAKLIDGAAFLVSAKSGERWHEFVLWTLERGYFGIENMSLIPGTVGASPIQNIGAYGVEIKDVCISVDAIELSTGVLRTFSAVECQFGYRESIFKRELKGQYFIYQVNFSLSRMSPIRADYGTIQEVLKRENILHPTHTDISNAVIEIRSSKLPLPSELGNAGSFFKNPIVDANTAENILKKYPKAPHFLEKNGTKIPAGWLIEQCGFKGFRDGNVGSHKDQALVIVNYGGATGKEIYDYSQKIIQEVEKKFHIILEREVNIIG